MRLNRRLIFLFVMLIVGALFYARPHAPGPVLSSPGEPPQFFYSPDGDYLQDQIIDSIGNAKQSILLMVYTLKDLKVLQALNAKARSGVSVEVIYDAQASQGVEAKLDQRVKAIARSGDGLMHLKMLVIDGKESWIGSANMTRDSLLKQSNLIAYVNNEVIAGWIQSKADQFSQGAYEKDIPVKRLNIDSQLVELRFLPDDRDALLRIKDLIRSAHKTVKVAIYTFTRLDLASTLVRAKNRGVDVSVVIDQSMARGAGKKVVDYLTAEGIRVIPSKGEQLFHHKFVLIDDEKLAFGSANWTRAAFNQNDDYIMILENLTPSQKTSLQNLWRLLVDTHS